LRRFCRSSLSFDPYFGFNKRIRYFGVGQSKHTKNKAGLVFLAGGEFNGAAFVRLPSCTDADV
jgi:hypothetical protein